jgi:hypothetical protein
VKNVIPLPTMARAPAVRQAESSRIRQWNEL